MSASPAAAAPTAAEQQQREQQQTEQQQQQQQQALLDAAEAFVREHLQGRDASHSWDHIARVRRSALSLARAEGLSGDSLLVVELAALLHDLHDHKYGGSDEAAAAAIREFLAGQGQQEHLVERVCEAVARVGFKGELAGGGGGGGGGGDRALGREAAVVQDADRLDAIGAVGIARCLTFGGARGAVLYDPDVPPRDGLTKAQYMAGRGECTTINHFYEKLLKIKGLMKTEAGRAAAQQRHEFMEKFLAQFFAEWHGEA